MVLVAMVYANGYLDSRLAENEFTTSKMFMQTTALQIDDIAWTIGRAQTVRYSGNYGTVQFQSNALNYTFEVYTESGGWQLVFNYTTGIIMYNMPATEYTISNDYFERIDPTNSSFLMSGASAPICHVYVIEKIPMTSGSFTRVVIAPSIRMLNSSINYAEGEATKYVMFYLPLLESGSNPNYSQSVTLIGKTVSQYVHNATQVRITASFPKMTQGFDSRFFNYEQNSITLNSTSTYRLAPNSVVEFYVGRVSVSLGLYL
jgi:hypothetical protein